jgi:hypothetical protein
MRCKQLRKSFGRDLNQQFHNWFNQLHLFKQFHLVVALTPNIGLTINYCRVKNPSSTHPRIQSTIPAAMIGNVSGSSDGTQIGV